LIRRCALVVAAALLSAGCGDLVRSSQSPSQLIIVNLLTSRGSDATTSTFNAGPLSSDIPGPGEGYFNDLGQATLAVMLRDALSSTGPSVVNSVTITRYRVVYRRTDGLNVPGRHVPQSFDGAVTATVFPGTNTEIAFELVRHNAKLEAPLAALGTNVEVIATIAEVTFFGRDQAGNEVSVTGNVQVNFGSFAG
jgi:hypothetical protein